MSKDNANKENILIVHNYYQIPGGPSSKRNARKKMNRMVFILETIHSLRNDERTTQSVTLIMIGGFFYAKK